MRDHHHPDAATLIDAMTVGDVADELYGLSLGDFTAARDERVTAAKGAGERDLAAQVKALRKPSATAWVLNQLVRHRSDEIESLLSLGQSLRDAQDDLDRETMRSLTERRRKVVSALARRAGMLAEDLGHRVNASALEEVERSLQAAMTDPAAADALRAGRLLRGLSVSGFDPVDLDGAVAVDGSPEARLAAKSPSEADKRDRELADAAAKAEETAAWAEQTEEQLASIDDRLAEIDSRRAQIESRQERLRHQLSDLEDELAGADRDGRALDEDRDAAARAARSARRSADRARDRLEYLS